MANNHPKQFSYEEITEKAKQRIMKNIVLANQADNIWLKQSNVDYARGNLECWLDITLGHIEDGDIDIMYDLLKQVEV